MASEVALIAGVTVAIVLGGGFFSLMGLKVIEISRESSRKNN